MTAELRRFTRPRPDGSAAAERCEMCAECVPSGHSHVVDLQSRSILCTCRACYLLFTRPGATRYRAVPERFRYLPRLVLDDAAWDSIGIPVRMAFFFTNSVEGRPVAFYPSPAGATESLLPLDAWSDVLRDNPALADAEADVEAVLINKEEGFESFLVPIDTCYELVGLVKLHWRGFEGGTEAWQAIGEFFAALRQRSELVADG